MGPLRADVIFAGLSRYSEKNNTTLAKKGREMACSAVANNTVNPTADSNSLEKLVSK